MLPCLLQLHVENAGEKRKEERKEERKKEGKERKKKKEWEKDNTVNSLYGHPRDQLRLSLRVADSLRLPTPSAQATQAVGVWGLVSLML